MKYTFSFFILSPKKETLLLHKKLVKQKHAAKQKMKFMRPPIRIPGDH